MAAEQINNEAQSVAGKLKVLIASGGTGRPALEILRGCQDLEIDFTDSTANNLQVLEQLLENRKVQWYQVLEGKLSTLLEFSLTDYETKKRLLDERDNSISYWQADYKNMRPHLTGYNVILVDFRTKNIGYELCHVSSRLMDGGLLILGSINEMDVELSTGRCSPTLPDHTRLFLERFFEEVLCDDAVETYAHMFRETSNKHEYTVSTYSVWRKKIDVGGIDEDDLITTSELDSAEEEYDEKEYLEKFHFGPGALGVSNYPVRVADLCVEVCRRFGVSLDSALDAGCGPGAAALHLCQAFKQVLSLFSHNHKFNLIH